MLGKLLLEAIALDVLREQLFEVFDILLTSGKRNKNRWG